MSHATIRLLATVAVLTTAVGAEAITITQTGLNSEGVTEFNPGDSVVLQYWLDNMGDPGLAVIAFSVIWDDYEGIVYDAANSKVRNKILKASQDEGGNTPNAYGGMPRLSAAPLVQGAGNEILFSWSSAPVSAWVEVSNQLLGTAVFTGANLAALTYIAPGLGQGSSFAQDTGSYANAGQAFADITDEVMFQGGGTIFWTPEPTTALLLGVGLAGLALGRARSRS